MEDITLKEHLLAIVDANDRRYSNRFNAQEKAVTAALNAADRAVVKAELATEKRFDGVNEFRAALSDQTASFIPRAEAIQRIDSNVEKIEGLAHRLDTLEGRNTWRS